MIGPRRNRPNSPLRFLLRNFLRGLLFVVPLAATLWIVTAVFLWVDGLVKPLGDGTWTIPGTDVEMRHGVGFLFTLAIITLIGVLTSTVLARWLVKAIDDLFTHLPVVKLIYTAIKDMVDAFVSDNKKFDKPVLLSFAKTPEVEVIGFVTREDLTEFGRADKVAVYVPQSYNFAANLILVPASRITPIDLPASDVMAFVVSGGVSEGTRDGGAEFGS